MGQWPTESDLRLCVHLGDGHGHRKYVICFKLLEWSLQTNHRKGLEKAVY